MHFIAAAAVGVKLVYWQNGANIMKPEKMIIVRVIGPSESVNHIAVLQHQRQVAACYFDFCPRYKEVFREELVAGVHWCVLSTLWTLDIFCRLN